MDTGRKLRAASVSASRESALSSISAAATLNSSCSTLDAPGNGDDVGQADQPRQRHLRGLGVDVRGDVAQRLKQRLDAAQVLGTEQRVDRANAAGPVVDAVLAAQKSLRQRAVGDHDAVLLLGEGDQALERLRVGE